MKTDNAADEAVEEITIWKFKAVYEGFKKVPHHRAERGSLSGRLLKTMALLSARVLFLGAPTSPCRSAPRKLHLADLTSAATLATIIGLIPTP